MVVPDGLVYTQCPGSCHPGALATAPGAPLSVFPQNAGTFSPCLFQVLHLNPIPPTFYQFGLGVSYSLDGQYEKRIQWCKKDPHFILCLV